MIDKLAAIFGSNTKAQEIALLLQDAKKVVRQGFYEEELPLIEQFCQDKKIFCVKSKFKVLIGRELYSNKGLRISNNDPRWSMFFIYFSKNEHKAHLASWYELVNNPQELGLLLGYPACCVDFFCRTFSEQQYNLELPATNPWTNLSLRNKDCVLLSHFPCHSECVDSIKLSQFYFQIIQDCDPLRAEQLTRTLHLTK